jgi:hypothetical protein
MVCYSDGASQLDQLNNPKKALVPHSQFSLRENHKLLPNFRHKNNTLNVNFQKIFVFNICLCNYGLALKGKNYLITTQICVYFIRENFENLRQEHK